MGNAEQLVIVSTKWDDEWVSQGGGGESIATDWI